LGSNRGRSCNQPAWQQLRVQVPESELAAIEALLTLAGAQSLGLDDAGDSPLLEPPPGAQPLWPTVRLSALFPASLHLEPLLGMLTARLGESADAIARPLSDAELKPHETQRAPLLIGERLTIGPPDALAVPPRRLLKLNFGVAFGTGTHPTTALCLAWLERNVTSGTTLLDYGCGSGILGLAALTLGASAVWAVDIEPQALGATRDNAELNAFTERIWIGPPEALVTSGVDIVVANILARPLSRLAEVFARQLHPGGKLVLSGLLDAQCAQVIATYEPWFSSFERSHREGWARISAQRRPAEAV
jgi:ribosomal protein L11 methyltransferase